MYRINLLKLNNFFLFSKKNNKALSGSGFSLIEVLVSIAIIGVLVAGVASIFFGGNSALLRTRAANQLEEAVDQDLARIKDIAFRMTCCSGTCTTESGLASPCSIDPLSSPLTFYAPGKQNYYFPDPVLDTTSSAITSFTNKCNSGGLTSELIALIGEGSLPGGVSREFNTTQAASHRLTVSYIGGGQSRSYTVVPTVSAWCP
jgi:prepilin-type N-terminal cleavage/methylation domain-containing protein